MSEGSVAQGGWQVKQCQWSWMKLKLVEISEGASDDRYTSKCGTLSDHRSAEEAETQRICFSLLAQQRRWANTAMA